MIASLVADPEWSYEGGQTSGARPVRPCCQCHAGEGAGIRTLNLGLKRPRMAIRNRSGPFASLLVGFSLGHHLNARKRTGTAALGE